MRHQTRVRRACAVAAALAMTLAAAPAADAAPSTHARELAQARAATARFHSIEVARAAGYVPVGPCVATPAGALGIPYGNFALLGDGVVDARRPEGLFYEPRADGSLRLVGVEYILVDADQDPQTDDDRPTLFGQAFDGPVAEPQAGLPVHYDLEAWLWRYNPDGLFATFNRDVHCPSP